MTLALAGNPNSGKTTLFNRLTGAHQRVGNWPGVTVEKKQGAYAGGDIIDLPGIYSLSPYTQEEVVARDFCLSGELSGILNIVDVTNLERNLYLSLQLAELGRPMVVALNMVDELRKTGGLILADALETALGIPVVPISARTGEGVDKLMRRIRHTVHKGFTPRLPDKDTKRLQEARALGELIDSWHTQTEMDAYALLADARYQIIEDIARRCLKKGKPPGQLTLSDRADQIFLGKWTGLPCLLLLLGTVFWLTFGPVGAALGQGMSLVLGFLQSRFEQVLSTTDVWTRSLLLDGVWAGLSAVLGFLPVILLLFLGLSLLEDSGYMARAALLLDKPMRSIGLSGRAFLPMALGFGCTVPAVLASRTLDNDRDRRLTIFLTPFLSCGAKAPLYALFAGLAGPLAMPGVYLLGVLAAILGSLFLQGLRPFAQKKAAPFLLELPPYRLPSVRTVLLLLWQKAKGFLARAFTLILAASVVVWFLSTFNARLQMTDSAHSLLARLGSALSWLFAPLGFGRWELVTALLAGLPAKEAMVSTLGVLYGPGILPDLSPAAAFSYMTFTLLSFPCVAALAAIRKELGGVKWLLAAMGFQTAVAWIVSFVVYQIGRTLGGTF